MRKGFLVKAAAAATGNVQVWRTRFGSEPVAVPGSPPVFLARRDGCSVIAEIKVASPSAGRLMGDRDPLELPALYEEAGAAAISVVVEEQHFGGSPRLFAQVRERTALPLLWKDFVVDPYQIDLAAALGASGILLIAGLLADPDLKALIGRAREAGLRPLVEVHDERELGRALDAGADLVGVNNRDLESLQVDLDVSRRLAPLFPAHVTSVSESGIRTAAQVRLMTTIGYDAVLVGEALVTAPDAAGTLEAMAGAGRKT